MEVVSVVLPYPQSTECCVLGERAGFLANPKTQSGTGLWKRHMYLPIAPCPWLTVAAWTNVRRLPQRLLIWVASSGRGMAAVGAVVAVVLGTCSATGNVSAAAAAVGGVDVAMVRLYYSVPLPELLCVQPRGCLEQQPAD